MKTFKEITDLQITQIKRELDEILWADIYNNTVEQSEWFVKKGISPGRWAVGYNYLYVMYRILNEIKPERILELGLGQSTKMLSQYAGYFDNIKHITICFILCGLL